MLELEDCPRPGCAGRIELARIKPIEALDVLAGKCRIDANGRNADGWTLALDDADFFREMSLEEKREIARFIAENNIMPLKSVRTRLIDTLEELTGDES